MIEDIRFVKVQREDENAALIVGSTGVYKLQKLVDGVWIDVPKPNNVEE